MSTTELVPLSENIFTLYFVLFVDRRFLNKCTPPCMTILPSETVMVYNSILKNAFVLPGLSQYKILHLCWSMTIGYTQQTTTRDSTLLIQIQIKSRLYCGPVCWKGRMGLVFTKVLSLRSRCGDTSVFVSSCYLCFKDGLCCYMIKTA